MSAWHRPPYKIRDGQEFSISHYITVSSPSGGSGGLSSTSFSAFSTRRASGQPPLTPRRAGCSSKRNLTSRTVDNACIARAGDRSTPGFLQPAMKQSLNQQRQRCHENMGFDSCFDLMIDRPHRHHILELPKPTLDLAQFLVHRHRVAHAQSLLAGRDDVFSPRSAAPARSASCSRRFRSSRREVSTRNSDNRDISA